MQHKNVKMSWDYWKFTRHPLAAVKYEIRGINTILSPYHSKVDPKRSKHVFAIFYIPCEYPACVDQLDKYWLPNCAPSFQPRYTRAESFYYNKIIEHCNDWIIVEFLDKNTPQVEFNNIHAFIIAVMFNNKT